MAQSRREQIKALLEQALNLPAKERGAFLDKACAGDTDLRDELDSLLVHADDAPGFFEDLAGGIIPQAPGVNPAGEDPLIGHHIAHYEILEKLGGGGMGVVYKALDTKLDRIVAIKFLTHILSSDEQAKLRFVQEAKAASALDHPNIGTIYEINETEDGRLYIAMAYYEGVTLKEVIAKGSISIDEAIDYTRQIAAGLAKAHEAGIVHRDIKPANVMLTSDGVIKIVDFGLAKMSGTDQLTKTGTTMGTVAYMSPEQIQGAAVDHRTDLWSLGVMFYEMLAGERPFKGAYESAMLYSIVHTEPESITTLRADVPGQYVATIDALLQKDAALRSNEAADIVTALAETHTPLEKAKVTLPGIALGLAALVVGALAIYWLGSKADGPKGASAANNLDLTQIAILPFDVRTGDELAPWREDMVEILHRAIQGSEEVRSVDPNAMLVLTAGDELASRDPVRGEEVARHFGAEWYLIGRVSRLGKQIRITPSLYRSGGEAIDLDPVVVMEVHQIQQAADTLAQRIVGTMLNRPGLRIATLASQTTHSPTAFSHFLQGQRFFREKRYEEGAEAFERALALDSTFALAAFQYGRLLFYFYEQNEVNQHRLLLQAERHIDKLPLSSQWLLQAHVTAFARGEPDAAEPLYKKYLERYPDDGFALISYGDFLFHNNPMRGRTAWEAKEYLEKGYRIVRSDQDDALMHLSIFAIQENNKEQANWVLSQSDSLRGRPVSMRYVLFQKMIWTAPEDRGVLIDSLAKMELPLLTLNLYLNIRDFKGAIRSNAYDPEPGRTQLAIELEAASGRFRAADSIGFDRGSDQYALSLFHRARAAASPWSSFSTEIIKEIRNEVLMWHPEGPSFRISRSRVYNNPENVKDYLLGLLSFRLQDDTTLTQIIEKAKRREKEGSGDDVATAVANILQVLQSARDGDVDKAIQSFHAAKVPLPNFWYTFDSPLTTQDYSRLAIAELLFEEQHYEEALPWYDSIFSGWDTDGLFHAAPTNYRKGQIHEILGNTEEAIAAYTRFIDYWSDPDPELQPMVDDAKMRLESLLNAMTVEA